MNIKKSFALVAMCGFALCANAQKLTSPDGNLVMNFSLNEQGAPVYTEILSDSDVVNGPAGVGIECLAEFVLNISVDDIYPFFHNAATTSTARFNTLGLFSACLMQPNYELAQNLSDGHNTTHLSADGYKEAYNTRLFSVVNFDNVSLREQTQVTYLYRVYASL